MATGQVDLALRLLQLIALALPAIALLMGVMVEIHKSEEEITDPSYGGEKVVAAITEVKPRKHADFAFAQYSIMFFVLSTLFLIVFSFVQIAWLLRLGVILIAVALISLGLSVFVMPRMTLSIWSRIKRGLLRIKRELVQCLSTAFNR